MIGTRLVSGGPWDVPLLVGVLGWVGLVPLVVAGGLVQARDDTPPAPQVGRPGSVERRRDGSVCWDHVVVLLVAAVVVVTLQQGLRRGEA